MKTILDMNHKSARRFFFRPRSYFSLALPSYYQFETILGKTREILLKENLCDYYLRPYHPRMLEDVNYKILYNKDGEYAWRKYQLIHPFFYAAIVHLITRETNWRYITHRIKQFRNPKIACTSMILAPTCKINKNEQDIFNWSGSFTNETVRKALDYKYMLVTDMTNCYDSLQLHLLNWALHGKDVLFDDQGLPTLGYQLNLLLQDMLYGQTGSLPQGSVLMDFLAELILSYIDNVLYERIKLIPDVYILRYRDDYRIFANEAAVAQKVMKILVETLAEFNLKINLSKTYFTSNLVKNAFKPDRIAWKTVDNLIFGENKPSILKSLFLIRDFGEQYPNCGSLKTALGTLYRREIIDSVCHNDLSQVVSVLADIMYMHPSVWPHCVAILSKYLEPCDPSTTIKIISQIHKKFADIPNIEYLEIWLQRLTIKADPYYDYDGKLCRLLFEKGTRVWNSDWLGMNTDLCDLDIISYEEVLNMPNIIPANEVALFMTSHGSGG